MELARIVGSVVASVKEPRLIGSKLLLAEPVGPDGTARPGSTPYVAVDLVGAGEGRPSSSSGDLRPPVHSSRNAARWTRRSSGSSMTSGWPVRTAPGSARGRR